MNGSLLAEERLRDTVADYSRRLHARGWVANHDGNITHRLGPDRILTTPTAFSKATIGPGSLVVVDASGNKVSGRNRSFSELGLHLACYQERPDVHAVVHAHPPNATGMAIAGVDLDVRIMPEPVVSLGAVATVPFAAPGALAVEALRPFLLEADALLLANHGVVTVGTDLETAYLRMELVEHVARITLAARAAGGVRRIPEELVARLLEGRRKAGLGPGTSPRATPASPAAAASTAPATEIRAIIAAEVAKVLDGR